MDYWSVISYCPDLLRFLFAFQFLGNIRSGQILYLASRAEQSGNKSWLAADKKHGTSLALLEPRSTSPNHRSSPKDDFSLEPTRPSTWLIAETDSSRTGTRNSCSANDGLKQFCPHTKFSANKKLSSCFNTGSFCIDSAPFPVFRSELFEEY